MSEVTKRRLPGITSATCPRSRLFVHVESQPLEISKHCGVYQYSPFPAAQETMASLVECRRSSPFVETSGVRWYVERFYGDALVTHFQHG
jgi:hypothetical protein